MIAEARYQAVVTALQCGRRKAQILLIQCGTLEMNTDLIRFIQNSVNAEYGADGRDDHPIAVRIEELISGPTGSSLVRKLRAEVGIDTLQHLLLSNLDDVRKAIADEPVYLQEIVFAMHPNMFGISQAGPGEMLSK